MVYTVRLAGFGRRGGRNGFEQQLRTWNVIQKNSRPNHPTTCGKAERFQQTLKKWLRAQPVQPSTIAELQALIDTFTDEYNHRRQHRSLPHRATPPTLYDSMPKRIGRVCVPCWFLGGDAGGDRARPAKLIDDMHGECDVCGGRIQRRDWRSGPGPVAAWRTELSRRPGC
jgi:Integrase core domain